VGVDHTVDAGYGYVIEGQTSTSWRIQAARVGYVGSTYFPLAKPIRKLDTRDPGPAHGPLHGGDTRTLLLTPQLPAGAAVAMLNVTIVDTVGAGFLSLYPSNAAWPGTSTLNWYGTGQILATTATVPVSPSGAVKILCRTLGAAQVIVDLVGYFR
jgi:hypothetical protein